MTPELYLGIMSGTSLDGIDIAICDFGAGQVVVYATFSENWPTDVRATLLSLAQSELISLDLLAGMHFSLASIYAGVVERALESAMLQPSDIRAIGLHGQTIRHLPKPTRYVTDGPAVGATLQIGNPSALAALTGIDVIGDFRSPDVALGGQGAPFMPMFDYAFLRSTSTSRLVVNIGGIANVSWLPAGGGADSVVAFDTGPGNMVMDALMREFAGRPYDADGALARTGVIDEELLSSLLSHEYFQTPPPKSTGRELFGSIFFAQFRDRIHTNVLSLADALATATELTSRSITDVLKTVSAARSEPAEIIVSGGGARNGFLMGRIAANAPNATVTSSQAVGIDPQYKEAIAFAYFAVGILR